MHLYNHKPAPINPFVPFQTVSSLFTSNDLQNKYTPSSSPYPSNESAPSRSPTNSISPTTYSPAKYNHPPRSAHIPPRYQDDARCTRISHRSSPRCVPLSNDNSSWRISISWDGIASRACILIGVRRCRGREGRIVL